MSCPSLSLTSQKRVHRALGLNVSSHVPMHVYARVFLWKYINNEVVCMRHLNNNNNNNEVICHCSFFASKFSKKKLLNFQLTNMAVNDIGNKAKFTGVAKNMRHTSKF